ncbi:MAG: single-stranded-DNA-specific exonuclease RecJ, partial [Psychrobacter sp.]|nr:single-stranded-DNA-specific exonuclease RecJ [Psychrobacter sp.]
IGIVAGRLKESHYLPSIVFAPADTQRTGEDDAIKGSARSIAGVHIRDAIEQVAERHPDLISHFGGHAMAAGLTLKRRNFEAFETAFNYVMAQIDDEIFAEQKFSDGPLQATDFSLWFAEHLADASIWGHGFAPPIFDGVFEVLSFKILKDKHLKLSLRYPDVQYPIEAIYFNFDSSIWDYRTERVHLLFQLDINEWNGKQSLQLMVKDLAVVKTT